MAAAHGSGLSHTQLSTDCHILGMGEGRTVGEIEREKERERQKEREKEREREGERERAKERERWCHESRLENVRTRGLPGGAVVNLLNL